MSDPAPTKTTVEAGRIPGKLFVPFFMAALALAVLMAVGVAIRLKPVVDSAHRKTFPLGAQMNAACRPVGQPTPIDLRQGGRCDSAGELLLSVTDAGTAAKYIGYAIVGDHPAEPVAVGAFAADAKTAASLQPLSPGPHVLVFLIADQPPDTTELTRAIALAPPGDVPNRLVKIEQYATVLRNKGADVRTERIHFRIEAGK